MKVWSAIFNLIAVILIGFMIIVFYRFDEIHTRQFEEQRLRYALDYSVEGAFNRILFEDDLGMDYNALENIKLSPTEALETFKVLMCINYDMSISEENLAHVESFIPTGVLFTNDGYYLLENVKKSKTDYGLKWSLKRPYLYSEGRYSYAVNIYSESWSRVDIFDNTAFVQDGESYLGTGLTKSKLQIALSDTINQDINYVIYERNKENRPGEKTPIFYLPSNTKSMIMNTIDRPALLMMIQNIDFACEYPIDAVSVGGVRVAKKSSVVGFVQNGIRYYCYEDQLPEGMESAGLEFFRGKHNKDQKLSPTIQAAQSGYFPHFEYLTRPKVKEE